MKPINSIFFIPVGDLAERKKENIWMVYSPLAESMVLVDHEEAKLMHDFMQGRVTDLNEDLREAAETLASYVPIEQRNDQIRSATDFVTLYVLPNYSCNFTCSYCFAANGRDPVRMKTDDLYAMIDWMTDPERTDHRNLYITFLGGGEPILSYETMKEAIVYGNHVAKQKGFVIEWSVVTNGSLITDDMLDFFKSEGVTLRYSFEVIPEIQLLQRGNFEKVHYSLKRACSKGLNPVIRAMITPRNVNRICEMVRLIADNYPDVKLFKIDPITDSEYGDDLEGMRRFYETFNSEYIEAKKVGGKLCIDVQCVTERNLDSVISRFCAGEIALNAYGQITACHRISSPREEGYEQMLYGRVGPNGVEIDYEKFRQITSDKVDTKQECADCFLKYNCAGGCKAQNDQYTPDMRAIVCQYTRELSRRLLFERIQTEK